MLRIKVKAKESNDVDFTGTDRLQNSRSFSLNHNRQGEKRRKRLARVPANEAFCLNTARVLRTIGLFCSLWKNEYMNIIYLNYGKLLWIRWKEDHRSYRHNFGTCEKKALKISGLYGIRTLWPLRCRCSALPTELTSHLGADHLVGSL